MRLLAELCWEERRLWWLTLIADPWLVEVRRSDGTPSVHVWAGDRGVHIALGPRGIELERDRL